MWRPTACPLLDFKSPGQGDRNARRDSPCLLGGLQFTGMPLLVLHIREDQVYAPTRTPDVRVAKDQDASPEAVQ